MRKSPGNGVVVVAMLAALVGGGVAAKTILFSGAAVSATARAESNVLININKQRAAHGLPPLQYDSKLANIARSWSMRMLLTGNFTHGDFEHRLYAAVGRRHLIAENIALGSASKPTTVYDWMHSPPHRSNILLSDAKRLGVGVAVGSYQGQPGTALITADFSS